VEDVRGGEPVSELGADLGADLGGPVTVPKSLTDLISAIRFRGDFRNVVRFPDANITVEAQAAWTELYELIADTNEGYWDVDAQVITVAGQPYVPLPPGTWRVRGIDCLCSSGAGANGTDYIELPQIGISDRNRYCSTTFCQPCAYRLTARGADLFPTPDRAYTLRVTYAPVAPQLGDPREYYNGWEEYVIYATLLRLALNEERDVSSWQAQLQFQRERIIRGASQRKAQEPEYLPLRDGYSGYDDEFDRDQRWWGR